MTVLPTRLQFPTVICEWKPSLPEPYANLSIRTALCDDSICPTSLLNLSYSHQAAQSPVLPLTAPMSICPTSVRTHVSPTNGHASCLLLAGPDKPRSALFPRRPDWPCASLCGVKYTPLTLSHRRTCSPLLGPPRLERSMPSLRPWATGQENRWWLRATSRSPCN